MPRSVEYMELKIFLEDRERWYRIKTGQEPKYNAMDAFYDHYRWYLLICPPLGVAIWLYLYFTVKAKIKAKAVTAERERVVATEPVKTESKPYENEEINTTIDNAEKEILRAMLVCFVDSFDCSKVRIRNGLVIMLIDDVCSEFSNSTVQLMINYSLITVLDRKYLTINL